MSTSCIPAAESSGIERNSPPSISATRVFGWPMEGLVPKGRPFARRANTALMRLFAIAAERWCYRGHPDRGLGRRVEANGRGAECPLRPCPRGGDTQRRGCLGVSPGPGVRAASRASRRVGPDDVVALFVGGDWDRKGLAVAIAAIGEAQPPGNCCSAVGRRDWATTERFRRYASDDGVEHLIDFIGPDSEPARWYRGADLFLSCSVYETFSLATVEAAAAGLPVVSTAVGVAPALVFGDRHR